MSNNMEGWYCQQDCRQVRMPSRMPESMDDTPEDEDDSSSQASSLPGCHTPGCRRHFPANPPKGAPAAPESRGNSLRSNATTHEFRPSGATAPPTHRSPRKCHSAVDIDRFGSAHNLERYHDYCTECIDASSSSRRRPHTPNGGIPRFPSSPSARRTMDHLPKSPNAEPFYPSKSPFRKGSGRFKSEQRRQIKQSYVICAWIMLALIGLTLYFVLLGESLRQRSMVQELTTLLAKCSNKSSISAKSSHSTAD